MVGFANKATVALWCLKPHFSTLSPLIYPTPNPIFNSQNAPKCDRTKFDVIGYDGKLWTYCMHCGSTVGAQNHPAIVTYVRQFTQGEAAFSSEDMKSFD
jgi:hypothetical protein